MAKNDLYVANQSFSTMIDGELYGVAKGDIVRAGHPLLSKNRMQFFEKAKESDYVDFDVEKATAAPGEER
jgi:hypothetical protein